MNDFIKTQQELAKETVSGSPLATKERFFYTVTPYALDTLITQIITNTGEELMRLAEVERVKKDYDGNDIEKANDKYKIGAKDWSEIIRFEDGHNQALDTIKQHITSVTGVE